MEPTQYVAVMEKCEASLGKVEPFLLKLFAHIGQQDAAGVDALDWPDAGEALALLYRTDPPAGAAEHHKVLLSFANTYRQMWLDRRSLGKAMRTMADFEVRCEKVRQHFAQMVSLAERAGESE